MSNPKFDIKTFTTERLIETRNRLNADFEKLNIVEDELAYKVHFNLVNQIETELNSRNVKF